MRQEYLRFPHEEWGVVVVTDYDVEYEREELIEQMRSFGLPPIQAKRALNILASYNTGMSISNDTLRTSIMYIGRATSPSEFWNTSLHELTHVVSSIIKHYDVDFDSEDCAYLVGYLTKQLVEKIAEPCR